MNSADSRFLARIEAWPAARTVCLNASFKSRPEDFLVEEIPVTAPSGAGEFALLRIEKRELNTAEVARRLAAFARVRSRDVSYAGRKDRRAVTRQWFSVHLAGRESPDWSRLNVPGLAVLESGRHHRKLRRGALAGNRFRVTLRNIEGDRARIDAALAAIAGEGVPNYFGPQRFGNNASNLAGIGAAGRLPRDRRSLALSAARAFLFNEVLAARVAKGSWARGLSGEIWMRADSRGTFGPDTDEESANARCERREVDPTGPLWGTGDPATAGEVRALEAEVAAGWPQLTTFLRDAGLRQERRRLRLRAQDLAWKWSAEERTLSLSFSLEKGAFATAVLHELGPVAVAPGPVC